MWPALFVNFYADGSRVLTRPGGPPGPSTFGATVGIPLWISRSIRASALARRRRWSCPPESPSRSLAGGLLASPTFICNLNLDHLLSRLGLSLPCNPAARQHSGRSFRKVRKVKWDRVVAARLSSPPDGTHFASRTGCRRTLHVAARSGGGVAGFPDIGSRWRPSRSTLDRRGCRGAADRRRGR